MFIELTGIKKSFQDGENRENHVLKGINLEMAEGEIVAVKGPSGSGKTTLLSILGSLIKADSGSYTLNGIDMTDPAADYSEIRNHNIGFVFQDHRLLLHLTALENILLPALAFTPQTTAEQTDYARQLLELTRISGLEKQFPQTLSGGEASRVAICRALIMKPSLLLADEPTGQLDSENALVITSLLTEINRTLGTTIIIVTHSEQASQAAHRILTLKDGILT